MVSTRERVIPGAGQACGGEGGSGHGHPPAPREFRLVPLNQKDGCGRSCGNADIPSCAELPVLEIDTAVFPLCLLMQCKC